MNENIEDRLEVAITSNEIKNKTKQLGKEINDYYGDREYYVVSILTGSVYFLAELTKYLSKKIIIDHMAISSYYGPVKKAGGVKVVLDLNHDIKGKDVLIVEDIIDTGDSLRTILELLEVRQPNSIEIVSLLKKKHTQNSAVNARWIGFEIENKFVIGYGLDYKKNYRNLGYIGYLNMSKQG